ncbi:MAG: flagellar basal body P-ring formation protein FlgA [Steroidobacteraceae bacterium]|jgi:flagella basal body P-ring formation protein FlgA|nr:flagellar basal body P-ring formation protein FlgA [Steroidobacteraceae bacterium]
MAFLGSVIAGLAVALALPGAALAADHPVEEIKAAAGAEALRLADPAARGLKVGEARVDPRLRLARCSRPLAAKAAPGSRAGGRATIEVSCPSPAWRVFVPVSIAAQVPVVVAARPLPLGVALAAEDLVLAERDLHALPRGYYTRIEDAVGLEVGRAIGAGEALTPAVARAGTVVRRGQQVILLARADGISVRMKGEALADGGVGHRVRVRNLSSAREVEGIVRSAGVVEVPM